MLNKLLHILLDGKIMNIFSAVSWTDIPTEVMATSSICNQDSVRICSLAVNMNNTDEKLLLYCRCLETLTFSLHKMLKCRLSAADILSGKEQRTHCSTCVAVAGFLCPHGDVACRTRGSRLRKKRQTGSLI